MQINIIYSDKNKIKSTTPLIRSLFHDTIKTCIKTVIENDVGFNGEITVRFSASDSPMVKREKFLMLSHTYLTALEHDLLKSAIKDIWLDAYHGIEKFENLLDMFGGKNPYTLFGSTNFGEMQC